MKQLLIIVAWIVLQPALCCRKNEDPPPINWKTNLPGTNWTGVFKYSSGVYLEPQPYSIAFSSTTFIWYDIKGSYTGTWDVIDFNKLSLNFTSGSKTNVVIGKNTMSGFKNLIIQNWDMLSLDLSSAPDPSQLSGTNWNGKLDNGPMKLSYLNTTDLQVSWGFPLNMAYSVFGSGVYFNDKPTAYFLGVFTDKGKTFKGVSVINGMYKAWSVTRE
jgi:hypothetical protein